MLSEQNYRVIYDDRDNTSTGRKFNEWEIKGVPIRLELGPKDLAKNETRLARRVDKFKKQVKLDDLMSELKIQMKEVHSIMYKKAKDKMDNKIKEALDWKTFMVELNKMQVVKTPWCKNVKCEDEVKEKSGI